MNWDRFLTGAIHLIKKDREARNTQWPEVSPRGTSMKQDRLLLLDHQERMAVRPELEQRPLAGTSDLDHEAAGMSSNHQENGKQKLSVKAEKQDHFLRKVAGGSEFGDALMRKMSMNLQQHHSGKFDLQEDNLDGKSFDLGQDCDERIDMGLDYDDMNFGPPYHQDHQKDFEPEDWDLGTDDLDGMDFGRGFQQELDMSLDRREQLNYGHQNELDLGPNLQEQIGQNCPVEDVEQGRKKDFGLSEEDRDLGPQERDLGLKGPDWGSGTRNVATARQVNFGFQSDGIGKSEFSA